MAKVMSYGAGTNSVAMLVGFKERGIRPDLILFADTGGERARTYWHINHMSRWLAMNDFPEITVVSESVTLEEDCMRRNALPGLAYGFKSCSEHFKIRPQKRWLKENGVDVDFFFVGIDAGESHRVKDDPKTQYPLVEWGWGRESCIAAIQREGLPLPGKSSCFFCPAMKPHEIRELQATEPDKAQRAIAMERNAMTTSIAGLGRRYSWESLLATDDMFASDYDLLSNDIPCGCYDGDAA